MGFIGYFNPKVKVGVLWATCCSHGLTLRWEQCVCAPAKLLWRCCCADAALLGSAHETERNEVGMVRYQYNIMGTRGPRRMTVVILKLGGGGAAHLGLPASDGSMTER